MEYNGEDSEYTDLANQMLEEFKRLCSTHLDGRSVKVSSDFSNGPSSSSYPTYVGR